MKRILLVGAGGMAQAWAKTIKPRQDVQLAGWVDIVPGKAEESAKERGFTNVVTGTDYPKLLDQVQPDFVLDVTIPESHKDVTIYALDHGYPVLGEKPMADSMESARAMVEASDRSGKLYMVSQSRRYNRNLEAYKNLVDQIGNLGILNSDFYLGPHFGGFRDEMPSPLILDMAIHTFDAARKIIGSEPVSCWAKEFNPEWSWMKGDASANRRLRIRQRHCLHLSWLLGRRGPQYIMGSRMARPRLKRRRHLGRPRPARSSNRHQVRRLLLRTPRSHPPSPRYPRRHRRLPDRVRLRPRRRPNAPRRMPRQHPLPRHGLRRDQKRQDRSIHQALNKPTPRINRSRAL